ncbi:ribosomal protein subunit S4 [Schizosaccharomyces cryophilus OY26]|uniref:Ribosomal protein subunit S4 n=1 Tax=Schizosaccharomyces cryophilus (strain OY26 / ATCC MYA-4695 / CBS 11777 / NBRC 106824 / NRRL Y48691) TaxID=653667 RepID=S9W564_SCHCR|nr:ribosomal protein subunit S4 [Schizosaccharomyces cryophilus OY26]EPY53689.1 ribosomal protein subunit S4 [Schizosaccharomyces cryophilus OY26]
MRGKPFISLKRMLLRPSWNKYNLYNIARKQLPSTSSRTLFQKKWTAKRETRAYHGPQLREYQLKNSFQPKLHGVTPSHENKIPIPFMSQMYAFIESRLDMSIHRAMFASSALQARQLVVHGKVCVNGLPEKRSYRVLKPGDLVTVNPISVLHCVSALNTKNSQQASSGSTTSTEKDESSSSSNEPEVTSFNEDTQKTSLTKSNLDPKLERAVHNFSPKPYMALMAFIPSYLEVCFQTCSFVYVRDPVARPGFTEVPSPFPEDVHALAYSFYIRSRCMRQGAVRRQAKRLFPQRIHDPGFFRGPRDLYEPKIKSLKNSLSERYPVRQTKLPKLV